MAVYTSIDNPELYFQCKIYTGTGSSNAITLDGSENMQPDLVWNKIRSGTGSHRATDAVRGVTEELYPDIPDAEDTQAQGVTAFGTNGFTVGTNVGYNGSSSTYVAWCWKESNSDAGFDIVSYTGNETARTQAHSLSAVPHVMIVKNRETGDDWNVYHHKNTSAPETDYLVLQTNAATNDYNQMWNDTAPTSSVFSLGTSTGVNDDTGMIAYLWAEKQGYSKFGSYTGNGNANGPFVFCGFRPAFLMCKRTDSSDNWVMLDNKRDPFNLVDERLFADLNQAEGSQDACDFLSNGFKVKGTSTWINASGGTFVYMAFAEAPFVNSNGVPANAR